MKLRIRGNSIRLRLTRSEVVRFGEEGHVEDRVRFGGGGSGELAYRLERWEEDTTCASFGDAKICIRIPEVSADHWVETDEVGLSASQDLPDGETLHILVEKDFQCLVPREGEDDTDTYPHPGQATGESC